MFRDKIYRDRVSRNLDSITTYPVVVAIIDVCPCLVFPLWLASAYCSWLEAWVFRSTIANCGGTSPFPTCASFHCLFEVFQRCRDSVSTLRLLKTYMMTCVLLFAPWAMVVSPSQAVGSRTLPIRLHSCLHLGLNP